MIYVGIVLCVGTPFLLLFGTRISAHIQARKEARAERQRLARLDARIAAERNPACRAALRMIRNDELGEL